MDDFTQRHPYDRPDGHSLSEGKREKQNSGRKGGGGGAFDNYFWMCDCPSANKKKNVMDVYILTSSWHKESKNWITADFFQWNTLLVWLSTTGVKPPMVSKKNNLIAYQYSQHIKKKWMVCTHKTYKNFCFHTAFTFSPWCETPRRGTTTKIQKLFTYFF